MSTPIALPPTHHSEDYQMGSYGGPGSSFSSNRYMGSPMSWRPGSFGAQFVPSQSPTAMLVGSYDSSRSPQTNDSSIVNAWNVFDRQGELCRNYSCCGTDLPDLHALLEHFEDVHIIVKDRTQPPTVHIPFNPQVDSSPLPPTTYNPADEMDLGLDYAYEQVDDSSPPPLSTAPTSPGTSRAPSPTPSPTSAQRPALNIGVGFPGMQPLSASSARPSYNAAFNRFGPGGGEDTESGPTASVAPGLVYAPEPEDEPQPVVVASGTATSSTHQTTGPMKQKSSRSSSSNPPSRVPTPSSSSSSMAAALAAAAADVASASMLLPHKPFRCPKPHCSKSYKQANGLKYHMTHGQCSYAPAKDVEAVRALLERKRAQAAQASSANNSEDDVSTPSTPAATPATTTSSSSPKSSSQANSTANTPTLSQAELNEVEARMRPYACGVGDCARRYKNMNGLRYHYQHTGDHGAVGLSLLAGGLHGCLALKTGTGTGGPAASVSAPATPTVGNGNATSSTYAWGSTLLPHIQAVASSSTAAAAKTKQPASGSRPGTPASSAVSAKPTPAAAPPNKKRKAGPGAGMTTFAVKPVQPPQRQAYPQQQQQQWYAGANGLDVSLG
ncbi:hypothetical protein MIND_01303700 [Mycena indigotica]|uniref:C2H2-type domain-containing protein n=1 Tax=Mycena indigotica TaxID=2126181 RepID=A0A8H6S3H5_9AGAR|nr:uncharacterized protein MIND_01303700 [Mycena indigotica]KAF7290635.1 hypothetical protein MIND_01303700 [Mycena indigotica]